MADRAILFQMAKQLLKDITEIQQRGAGYYSTAPFVNRYNQLVDKAKIIYADSHSVLLDTFNTIEDTKSVDPMDKMKVTQRVIVELGQLLAFMESVHREETGKTLQQEAPTPPGAAHEVAE